MSTELQLDRKDIEKHIIKICRDKKYMYKLHWVGGKNGEDGSIVLMIMKFI